MEQVPCNLCGSSNFRILHPATIPLADPSPRPDSFRCTSTRYGLHPPVVECQQCGLVYTNPRPSQREIIESYRAAIDETYLEEREGRVLTFRHNLAPLEKWLPPRPGRRLLDVGCHIGVLMEIASERGWEAWGVEPSTWAAEEARKKGLRVVTGTLTDGCFPDLFFDAVTMWDVIEHLTDPRAELQEVNRILVRGGILGIHTMNIESPTARLLGARWPWLMEMHLYYFSLATLAKMLESTGFRVQETLNQGRYLRLGYLISRTEPYFGALSRALRWTVQGLGLTERAVEVNLGDLFTVVAIKE